MHQTEIEKKHQAICQGVYQGRFKSAIDMLAGLLKYTTQAEYFYQIDSISDNYQNLLKYAFEGYEDSKRKEILDTIAASILSLADEIRQNVMDNEFPQRRVEKAMLSREIGEEPSVAALKIEDFLSGREVEQIIKDTGMEITEAHFHENIFKFIWLSGKFREDHKDLIRRINRSSSIQWHEKCLVVSALTLSLLNHFDQEKILLLTEFIDSGETQVYQRALIGLVLALLYYDKRISFYPDIVKKLKELSFNESIQKDTEVILLQLLMAKETEKITKEFEEEILPEMKKVMPKLEDKLQLGNLLEEDDMEGKNPDWKELIDEVPGLFERIEKFTRMQMEGGDVFMSTFSLLKRFDFFNLMSNWFVPFYPGHPELKKIVGEEEEFSPRLLEGLEKAFYICNSDKYSFALNFQAVPQQQRSMIITYFESELEQMKEMVNEEQMLDKSLESNAIMTQYIQDLYRFYKLYPNKNEFLDIFQVDIRFNQLYFYRTFFEREGFTERLAAFYFDKGHYSEAIEVYKYVVEKGGPKSEYFEKIGYSWQQLGRFKLAIEQYKKAELFDANRLWILKKLGWCCMKIKDYENAVKYFEDAGQLQPDDLNIQAQIGHCQLKLDNFDEALQHYSKVRYFQPDNLKVLRPIAYCQFVLGKLDNAAESYEEILAKSDQPASYDLMNSGHVLFCLGRKKEALEQYRKSRADKLFTTEMFMEAFEEDVSHLLENGVRKEEIPLLLDYLLFQTG
jgi:tetratricopeptide (TPR) repeat protein